MAMKRISDEQVCRAVARYSDDMKAAFYLVSLPYPYETLAVETGECEKVCYRAMERAERRGFLEYGVSLRTGWLTSKGKALIGHE